jgi:hypothetical protein
MTLDISVAVEAHPVQPARIFASASASSIMYVN